MVARIRLNDGCPWPERRGCTGTIAVPPASEFNRYPVHGLGKNEVIVLLDDDPFGLPPARWWSCVVDGRHIDYIPTDEDLGI